VISYSIYLDQGLVVRAWQMAFQVFWHNKIEPVQAALAILALLAIVVLVSAWTYRWIEEPARRYFSRFVARKRLA
jgi:peptidoglycan/LPS O-acetylase OafA/YrhL